MNQRNHAGAPGLALHAYTPYCLVPLISSASKKKLTFGGIFPSPKPPLQHVTRALRQKLQNKTLHALQFIRHNYLLREPRYLKNGSFIPVSASHGKVIGRGALVRHCNHDFETCPPHGCGQRGDGIQNLYRWSVGIFRLYLRVQICAVIFWYDTMICDFDLTRSWGLSEIGINAKFDFDWLRGFQPATSENWCLPLVPSIDYTTLYSSVALQCDQLS
jgi:hypothetical protein